ncbi:MAG: sensor histidine kinase [Bryobacteraceae bacterium]
MNSRGARFRSARAIIAISAALTLLVTGAVGWLGWRLLAQEEVLERQRSRDRIELRTDALLAAFLRRIAEEEAALARIGSELPAESAPLRNKAGAVLVLISRRTFETKPERQLLYRPVVPRPHPLDARFAQADQLEFQSSDLSAAAAHLTALAASAKGPARAEAILRLGRIEAKRARLTEALSAYAQIRAENAISQVEVPYALLARFARCQALARAKRSAQLAEEASALVTAIDSGEWPLGKESYSWYREATAKLAGLSPTPPPPARAALAGAVESLFEDWRLSRTRSPRAFGDSLLLINVNGDRLVALAYPPEAVRQFALSDPNLAADRDAVALTDGRGRVIAGAEKSDAPMRATRTLAAAQLPWTLQFTSQAAAHTSRTYFALGLAALAAIVALACYAMARGVLRELQVVRLQSDFVSAVSHEFRSPLTTLRQLTELLAHGRVPDESRRSLYFDVLQRETSRLHRLVENLLDFGRMEADRRQYSREPLDFTELVRDSVREYEDEIRASGYTIELAAESPGTTVRADREALRRVVRNLLENAVKYSPECRTVWVEAAADSREAVLRVRDSGIGIAPEEQSRIFDRFVRGEAAKRACIQGTGIGLAMVKEIVLAHHGDVAVASESGRGSTFTVRLPASRQENGSPQ